jgi:hypothetical protein
VTRLKQPAYCKRLLDERRAGRHPLSVNLVYGDKWFDVAEPRVCIMPDEYKPGVYDFHALAGLRVTVHDQLSYGWDVDDAVTPPRYGRFFSLLREVAECDALVLVRWPKGTEPRETLVHDMAFCCRWRDAKLGPQWPAWWSDDLNARQAKRIADWHAFYFKEHERGRAA